MATLSTLLELTPGGVEERATIQGLLDCIVRGAERVYLRQRG